MLISNLEESWNPAKQAFGCPKMMACTVTYFPRVLRCAGCCVMCWLLEEAAVEYDPAIKIIAPKISAQ